MQNVAVRDRTLTFQSCRCPVEFVTNLGEVEAIAITRIMHEAERWVVVIAAHARLKRRLSFAPPRCAAHQRDKPFAWSFGRGRSRIRMLHQASNERPRGRLVRWTLCFMHNAGSLGRKLGTSRDAPGRALLFFIDTSFGHHVRGKVPSRSG